jgi:hypothetical protein
MAAERVPGPPRRPGFFVVAFFAAGFFVAAVFGPEELGIEAP